jgi:hypothetical protein
VPEAENIGQDTLQRSDSEPSVALSLADNSLFDEIRGEPIVFLLEDCPTELEEAVLHSLPDEGSVFPSEAADLSVARYPTSPHQDGDDGSHLQEAAQLEAHLFAISQEKDALRELIQANQPSANLTEEVKRATRLLKPKPPDNAECDDDRKPAAVSITKFYEMDVKKKSTKRGRYKCYRCGNEKKDHICDLLVKSLFPKETQTVNAGEEIKGDGDTEILVRDGYEEALVEASPPNEQERQEEPTYAPLEPRMDIDVEASANTVGIPNPFFDPPHLEQASETGEMNVDDEDGTEAVSDAANTMHEGSTATEIKQASDTGETKRKNDDEPAEAQELRGTESADGPVEEPPGNDQETIVANARSASHVDTDEEIEIVPV